VIYREFLFKQREPLLNRGLDAYAMRQRVISKNIANASSPHYRPEMVKFEEYFHEAKVATSGSTSDDMHIPIGTKSGDDIEGAFDSAPVPKPEVYFAGESHVNIDKEMSELAINQIKYRFASRAIKSYFTGLQSAIKSGNY
jgi:flagellar basal-body rod protein FlgB